MDLITKTTTYHGSFDKNTYSGIDVPMPLGLLQPFFEKFKVALEEIRAKSQFCFGVLFDVRLNSVHHHSRFPHSLYWPITIGMESFIEGDPAHDVVITSKRIPLDDMEKPTPSLAILFDHETSEPYTKQEDRDRFFQQYILPIQGIVEKILVELEQEK